MRKYFSLAVQQNGRTIGRAGIRLSSPSYNGLYLLGAIAASIIALFALYVLVYLILH